MQNSKLRIRLTRRVYGGYNKKRRPMDAFCIVLISLLYK